MEYATALTARHHPPMRDMDDVRACEQQPLEAWVGDWDFAAHLLAGCERDLEKTAIHYLRDGDADAPALQWRYRELRDHAVRIACALRARGLGRDDAVAIVMPTTPVLYAALIGAFLACRPFPVNWMLDAGGLGALLAQADVKAVITLSSLAGEEGYPLRECVGEALRAAGLARVPVLTTGIAGTPEPVPEDLLSAASGHPADPSAFLPRAVDPGDVAAYLHSGGTTSDPKIIKVTHRGLVYRLWGTSLGLAFDSSDVVLSDTPMFHVGGLCARGLVSVAEGMSIVIPSVQGARDKQYLKNYWKIVERFRVTRLSGVPTTLSALLRQPVGDADISSLRACFATGSTGLAPAVQAAVEARFGTRPLMMYGLTENTSNVTIDPRDGPQREMSSGLPVPYTSVRVVELDARGRPGRECPAGQVGHVMVQGPGVAAGYLDPRQDEGVFLPGGWLLTGDLGRVDEQGYVYIVGRSKDLIIRGGHNIDPRVIEHALMQCPKVAQAAAVGKLDAHAGELPVAYVELHPGEAAEPGELLDFCARRIAERAAIPKEIHVLDRLPLSAVGKPLKRELALDAARRALDQALAGARAASGGQLRWQVAMVAGSQLRLRVMLLPSQAGLRPMIEAALAGYAIAWDIQTGGAEGGAAGGADA